ncbi:MAG: PP2C family serine/threonine-protein phosphatase [Acutalibacteraceae bacterium]|nr:PP2C family serine/threonine-protein phosphatase [Acutalibacteraceae bacterium]
MNFIVSANTDIGIAKSTNQDSLSVKVINTPQGRMTFAILCDGMGGLAKGEVASASVIRAFDAWVRNDLAVLCNAPIEDSVLRAQWNKIVTEQNKLIGGYGARQGIRLGTTAVIMLLTQTRYYIMNVGDSRAYEITDGLKQLTNDQTFVAREVALGNMTEEQAKTDERRSVLLQCIGASNEVYPDMFFGDVRLNAVYMLCSDGFRHEITKEEIYEKFQPNVLFDDATMSKHTIELIELNKQRQERDNISVVMVRTF